MRVFGHCPRGLLFAVYAALCVSAASAQSPAVADPQTVPGQPPNTLPGEPPLTPEQQRQREIDKYDPLKRKNPLDPGIPGENGAKAPDPQSGAKPYVSPAPPPLPGSIADSNDQSFGRSRDGGSGAGSAASSTDAGPQVVDDSASASSQSYHGPAVLSRSYTLARPSVPKELKWQWTIGTVESYQSGLMGPTAVSATGSSSQSSLGSGTAFTFTGRHLWKRDQFGVDYGADYTRYTGANAFNGLNQHLSLDYGHVVSSHLIVNLVASGSILSSNYSLQNPLTMPGVSPANISLAASPAYQLLDQRTRQFQTTASLTWQKSSRLSFNMSGGLFAVDRGGAQAPGALGQQLTGNVGYQAQADVNYRYTSRMTVGAYYSYTTYTYTKHESVSDTNTVGLIYSYAFDRSTQLRLRFGISGIESLSYTQVPLDPVFAFLTGEIAGIVDQYRKSSTSDISGQFIRDFGHSRTGNISFARGVAPGNGTFLTSVQETMAASYSSRLFRRVTVNFSGGRTVLSAQVQNTGNYTTNYAAFTISRPLPHRATASFSVNYTLFDVTNMPGLHPQWRIASTFAWGPGPGKLW
jgi:hypothetical protein